MKNNSIAFVFVSLFLLLTIFPSLGINAAEIELNGECFFVPSEELLQSFQSILFSPPGAASVSIFGTRQRWKIMAKAIDRSLVAGNIQLWVRRTNDGIGPGEITGGTFYVPLEAQEKAIFRGIGDISHIPLQFKLTGITPETPENAFQSEIFFKVVDMP
ncbi:MAG: hypothetical protein JW971_03080 [Synergistales bacterium]|nr:hypothetical protein [Synergistales bacterium]